MVRDIGILWAIIVVIGAAVGHYLRNRGLAGFLITLVLGPLGWLVVLLFEDHRKKCPDCRSTVDPLAKKCARCGAALEPKAAASTG